jgi:rubrerythrin
MSWKSWKLIDGKGYKWRTSSISKEQYKKLKEKNPNTKFRKIGEDIYELADKEYYNKFYKKNPKLTCRWCGRKIQSKLYPDGCPVCSRYGNPKSKLPHKIEKFLSKFPNKTTSWKHATDEIRDIARTAKEYHNEFSDEKIKPLNFRDFKTPSEWNTKGKQYIKNVFNLMNSQAKKEFIKYFDARWSNDRVAVIKYKGYNIIKNYDTIIIRHPEGWTHIHDWDLEMDSNIKNPTIKDAKKFIDDYIKQLSPMEKDFAKSHGISVKNPKRGKATYTRVCKKCGSKNTQKIKYNSKTSCNFCGSKMNPILSVNPIVPDKAGGPGGRHTTKRK